MTRSPTFSPAAETTTPPQTFGPAAHRPSLPGLTSPALPCCIITRTAGHRSAHRAFRQSADAKLAVPLRDSQAADPSGDLDPRGAGFPTRLILRPASNF